MKGVQNPDNPQFIFISHIWNITGRLVKFLGLQHFGISLLLMLKEITKWGIYFGSYCKVSTSLFIMNKYFYHSSNMKCLKQVHVLGPLAASG